MQLYSPWILLLLLILPIMAYMHLRRKNTAAIKFPSLSEMKNCQVSWRVKLRPILFIARLLCIALLIFSLARPRKGTVLSEISTKGIAIEVIADRSGSMQAEMDYYGQKFNRLAVVKKVLSDFIKGNDKNLKGRNSDMIGLVTFARYADTLCPLVLSHNVLLEFLNNTDFASRDEDGTAIGDAIALAAARLKKAEDELKQRNAQLSANQSDKTDDNFKIASKIIILLTDGNNNAGQRDPLQAAELAKQWGIKIYTIGIGSDQAYTTIQTPLGNYKMPTGQDLDEGLLKAIAENTGGVYGRADTAKTLEKIIEKIDKMEKSEVKSVQYTQYSELFGPWTLAALCMLLGEIAASCTIFRKIP